MNKRIELAGIPIEIKTMYNSFKNLDEYITQKEPYFCISINEQDIANEKQNIAYSNTGDGVCYKNCSPIMLESTAIHRKIAEKLPEYDAFVIHGSAVAVGEKAYIFTAKSGTGKTTHTELWLENIKGSYVPMYEFYCNMESSAATVSYEEMSGTSL